MNRLGTRVKSISCLIKQLIIFLLDILTKKEKLLYVETRRSFSQQFLKFSIFWENSVS